MDKISHFVVFQRGLVCFGLKLQPTSHNSQGFQGSYDFIL